MVVCVDTHTFLEEIHILNRGAFFLLCGDLLSGLAVVVVKKIPPQILPKRVASIPCSSTLLALPPPTLPPRGWRRCRFGVVVDSSHNGSIQRGCYAQPVPPSETRACRARADCKRREEVRVDQAHICNSLSQHLLPQTHWTYDVILYF